MNTPVLTKVQQKRTLSAKKRFKKATIKSVLGTPYCNYWPLLQPQDSAVLQEVLNKHLKKIKAQKINVPWNQLKNVPRENRKAFRLNYSKNQADYEEPNCKSAAVFGINETSKLLESNRASSVLISDDVNPQFMVKHILDLAVLKRVPVLVVPKLKTILKEGTGISSLAVSFKATTMDSHYWAIDHKIKEMHCNYPIPKNHVNYNHREEDKSASSVSPMDLYESGEEEKFLNLHLYRKSKVDRVFVPKLSQEGKTATTVNKMEVDSSGFLAFGDDTSNKAKKHNEPIIKSKVSYKSLIVKRVVNNKDRGKRKIETLKRKLK